MDNPTGWTLPDRILQRLRDGADLPRLAERKAATLLFTDLRAYTAQAADIPDAVLAEPCASL